MSSRVFPMAISLVMASPAASPAWKPYVPRRPDKETPDPGYARARVLIDQPIQRAALLQHPSVTAAGCGSRASIEVTSEVTSAAASVRPVGPR
jgi:hypothetical protein